MKKLCNELAQEELNDGSEILVSVDGKSKLTVKSFEEALNFLLESERFRNMTQISDIKEQLFNAKKNAIVHSEWAKNEGIADSDEFKKKYKMICDDIKDQLNHDLFAESYKAEVSDIDAKKFYDENKDDPRLMKNSADTKPEYYEFEEVRDGIKQMLQEERTEAAVEKATKEYAQKIGLTLNTKYFENIKKH